ncbi:MAG: tyrosine-type recombinase/integrase [Bacteroidota bacterium]
MASLFRRSNGIYYLLTLLNGRRVWKSTGCRKKSDALRQLSEPPVPEAKETSQECLSMFSHQLLKYLRSNLSLSTVALYGSGFGKFVSLIGDLSIRDITPQHVEQFKLLRLREVSPVKVNIDFRVLRAGFNIAINWGLIDDNPFRKSKQIRIPVQRPTYLSREEFERLIKSVDRTWFQEIIFFAVTTMMRLGEIVNLEWESVDLEHRLIAVENTEQFRVKTHKPRTIPMNDWVVRFLERREKHTGKVFTFPDGRALPRGYVSSRFKKYVRSAGLNEKVHFHTLRHTGASWLVQTNTPIYSVQQILGHSSIAMTEIYSHLEVEHLRKPLEGLDQYLPKGTA